MIHKQGNFHHLFSFTVEAPTVVEPLQPVHVVEGSTVQLMCTIKGDDLAIRWYEKGQPITTESNRWVSYVAVNTLSLESGCFQYSYFFDYELIGG